VACVQLVVAAAGNNLTRGFDVTPGQDLVAQLNELPVGNVTITAFAFQSNCAGVGTSHPNWASSPTVATILPGQVTAVSLTLEPVGDASVGVHFDVDAGAPADMAAPPPLLISNPGGGFFGTVVVGAQADSTIFITNVGGTATAPMVLSSIAPPTDGFFIGADKCVGVVLAPKSQCTVSVTFKPPVPAPFSSFLMVGDGSVSAQVALHGQGAAPPPK
jgi:hypothetical protein